MKSKSYCCVRKWLNKIKGSAYIVGDVHMETYTDNSSSIYADLEIGDCYRKINLDFGNDANTASNLKYKIEVFDAVWTKFRDAVLQAMEDREAQSSSGKT